MTDVTNQVELEARRAAAIAEDRCFSVSRLRDEFRMKPAPGVDPVKMYKSPYGGKYGVYRIAECVPMRAKVDRTEKQVEAGKKLGRLALLNSARGKGAATAFHLVEALNAVFLDTETTGLGSAAEAIEIGVTDATGTILLDVRLYPTCTIDEEAAQVHGITLEQLIAAPNWLTIEKDLREPLSGRPVVIFNESFDRRILQQTARAHGDPAEWIAGLDITCAMKLAAKCYGATNKYGTISLTNAVLAAGVQWAGKPHSATGDAATTANIVHAMADIFSEVMTEEPSA